MRYWSERSSGARVYADVAPSTRTTTSRIPLSTYAIALPSTDHFVFVIEFGVSVLATERRRELSAFASHRRWSPFGSARQYASRPDAERSVTACREALAAADGDAEAAEGGVLGLPVVESTIATTEATTTSAETNAYGTSPRTCRTSSIIPLCPIRWKPPRPS